MTITSKPMTADELLHRPSDNMRHELVKGELRTMPPSGYEHGEIVVNITIPLGQFIRAKKLGKVYGAETGFILERDPDTVLAPDVSFVSKKRLPAAGPKQGFFPAAPDLAVEVMSPSESVKKAEKKANDWLDAGSEAVWVINPKKKTVTIYGKSAKPVTFNIEDTLNGGDVVPGFSLPVREIFED